MKKFKEVTVFVSDDSSKISTWSNVPFFFTETLLVRGVKVNRVDISPSLLINTTPKWSSFSASVEAIYFYTPVILTPYKEFLQTFDERINFGCYCEENSAALLKEKVLAMHHQPAYQNLCVNAHEAVKEFTWDAYMNKLIQ